MSNQECYLGAIHSPYDVRDYYMAPVTVSTFPEKFSLEDLSPMPTAKHQGTVNSCVAHALATIIEWYSRYQGDEIADFSVGYIYGNRNDIYANQQGMVIREALATVCQYGDVIKSLFTYNMEVPDIVDLYKQKADELYKEGIPHRFSSYYRVYGENEIKTSLKAGHPLIIGLRWFSDITVLSYKHNMMETSFNPSYYKGLHALVVYGWNEHGWLVQNSHGENWGKNGRAVLPYDYEIREAYAITDEITENTKVKRIQELEALIKEKDAKIEELNNAISKYMSEISLLNSDIERLSGRIQSLTDQLVNNNEENHTMIDQINAEKQALVNQLTEKSKSIADLTAMIGELTDELANAEEINTQQAQEIVDLENTIIEIKKPFQSEFGKIVAKILNFVFGIYDNIKHKDEKKVIKENN